MMRARETEMTKPVHYVHPLETQPEDRAWCGADPYNPDLVMTTDHNKVTCRTCVRTIAARRRVEEQCR